jgi:hypothetical protein
MKKYYIYHIKGKKIGCSTQLKRRISLQGFTDYEILEEHTDILIASDRERELQKIYGYRIDKVPYWKTIKIPTFKSCSKGGKQNVQNGTGYCNFESRSKGGKITVESGHLERIQKARQRQVIQMDKLGNSIQEFESVKLTANTLNLDASTISKCCKGKCKSIGGYTFKYK